MKPILTIALLCTLFLLSLKSQAQIIQLNHKPKISKHLVTIAPLGIIVNKARMRYEYVATKRSTCGFQYTQYYNHLFPGLQAVVIYRFYLTPSPAPNGLYLIAQAGMAYYHATTYDSIYSYSSGGLFLSSTKYGYKTTREVEAYGLVTGLAIGYQTQMDKYEHWILDMYFGFKQLSLNRNLNEVYVNRPTLEWFSDESPYKTGIFSEIYGKGIIGILNCGINVGYRF